MITPRQARHRWPLPSATISLVVCVAVATFQPAQADNRSEPRQRADADRVARHGHASAASLPVAAIVLPATLLLGIDDPAPPTGHDQTDTDQRTGDGPIPPARQSVEPLPGESPQAGERRIAAQQGLNEFLVRGREYRVLLSQAERALAEGRTSAAISALQAVLDASHDVFLWPDGGGPPVSARSAARRVLRQLPDAARAGYERKYGDTARQLWDDYRRRPDPALLAQLLDRFSGTRAGGEALAAVAQREMDCGNVSVAAGLWNQLLADSGLAAEISIADRVRAQIAFALSGVTANVPPLPPDLAQATVTFAGTTRPAREWVNAFLADDARRSAANRDSTPPDWCLPLGGVDPHRRSAGSRPVADPLWSASYLAPSGADTGEIVLAAFTSDTLPDPDAELASVVQQWTSTRLEQRAPLAAATFPIVVGGLVVVRDYSHITARDVRTGVVAWRFPCASSVHRLLAEQESDANRRPSPVTIGRSADRPSAVVAFDTAFAENGVVGMLSSDGCRVFAVDALESDPARSAPDSRSTPEGPTPVPQARINRIVALQLGGGESEPGGKLLWSVGGPVTDGAADSANGCFFLGPPVPDGNRLFAVAECRRELHLLALDAASGRLLWRQPVSLVDIPLDGDPLRERLACSPAVAQGIVVCPTQLGTLVGVDAVTGTLLWVYSHVEEAGPYHVGRWQHAANRRFGSAVFPDLPLIIDDCVVVLPHQSEFVHCIGLRTGAAMWAPQPREGAFFAAAGNSDTFLLIGERHCSARHLGDGRQLWKSRIATPVGRGVVAGDHYLLPTCAGAVTSLDVSSGRTIGNLLPPAPRVTTTAFRPVMDVRPDQPSADAGVDPTPSLGNLCVYGEFIVSTSPTGVSVFPQAEVALRALIDHLNDEHAPPADLLRAAELQLQLGRPVPAGQLLQRALRADPPAAIRTAAENDLREVLYASLADGADPAPALSLLDPLNRNPDQRGRFLVERLATELNAGDTPGAVRTVHEALQLPVDRPVVMTSRGEYLANPLRRMSLVLRRAPTSVSYDAGRRAQGRPHAGMDHDGFRSQLDLFGALPDSGPIRLQAATADLESGRFQSAELLLLQALADPLPDTAAAAAVMLCTFWEDRGLLFEAVELLEQLLACRGQMRLADGATLAERLAQSLAGRRCWRVCSAPETAFSARNVDIDQTFCPEGCPASDRPCECDLLSHLFVGNREFYRVPGATLRMVDRGIQPAASSGAAPQTAGTSARTVRLAVVDRASLRQTARIDLPPHAWRAGTLERYDAGHLLPVVGAEIYGISLLEGQVVWSLSADSFDPRDKPWIGPYGPGFCIVQAGSILTALDPADGRVLWQRSDLDYDAGFVTDDDTGIVGDDRAIVVFDADRVTYRVFDTRSGEVLRTGTLEASPGELRKRRWNFGRRLLLTTSDRQQTRLRLWDPLDNACPVDIVTDRRLLHCESCRDGLLTILNGNRLTLLDVDANREVWTRELDRDVVDGVRMLNVYSDHSRHYVHLERDVSQARYNHLNGDVRVPHLQVEGDLIGIDRATGDFWKRTLPRCNLLLLPQHRLPYLVGVSRVRDPQQKQTSMLMVQVIDAATGDLLQQREDLVKTSIVHTACDPVAGRLDLAGIGSRIQIRFSATPRN